MFDDLIVDKDKDKNKKLDRCPFCRGLNTVRGSITYDKDKKRFLQKVRCNRCEGSWFILYKPDGKEPISIDVFDDASSTGC